jgi:acyl-coenzyme A thioesterase PaaI-like protein
MNKLSKLVNNIGKLPGFMQKPALFFTLGNAVKFAGTSGIIFEKMSSNEVILFLQNKKKVQNHIGQIHAAATALLTETATGMIVGMNLPDDKIPLLKQMKIDYVKRSQGQQKAVAILDSDAITKFETEVKGEILVPVTVTDAVGTEVIKAEMLWAWIPKSRIKS